MSQSIKYMTVTSCNSFAFITTLKKICNLTYLTCKALEMLSRLENCSPRLAWIKSFVIHQNTTDSHKNKIYIEIPIKTRIWIIFYWRLLRQLEMWSEIHISLRYNLERKLIVARYAKKTQARQISSQKLKVAVRPKQTRETFAEQSSWVRSKLLDLSRYSIHRTKTQLKFISFW